jgi:putative ABC transport system permease protein
MGNLNERCYSMLIGSLHKRAFDIFKKRSDLKRYLEKPVTNTPSSNDLSTDPILKDWPVVSGKVVELFAGFNLSILSALVNQEFVNRHLKGNPLGQRLSIEEIIPGLPKLGPPIQWQIVGIFHDIRYGDFRGDYPEVDVPFSQSLSPSVTIGVRTAEDPASMTKAVAAAVHSIDPQIALANVRTMDQIKSEALADDRFTMLLYASFGAVALVLAGVGIYGLMAFAVSQRTAEIGVRMALGADRGHVTGMILKEGSVLALFGLLSGVGGALLVGRTMQKILYGIDNLDFSVIASVAVILFATALLASYLPARRAASIDPMQALRSD